MMYIKEGVLLKYTGKINKEFERVCPYTTKFMHENLISGQIYTVVGIYNKNIVDIFVQEYGRLLVPVDSFIIINGYCEQYGFI